MKLRLSLLTFPAQNLRFIDFIISLFYYFLMLALGLSDLASLQSYSMPLVILPASSPCSCQSFQIKK